MNSSTVNRVTLVGYCGETPEMIYIKSTGNPVCNFRVATHKNYKNKEGVNFEATIWHKVSAWNNLAEYVAENVKKGSKLYIEGELSTSSYTTPQGVRKDSVSIQISELKVL